MSGSGGAGAPLHLGPTHFIYFSPPGSYSFPPAFCSFTSPPLTPLLIYPLPTKKGKIMTVREFLLHHTQVGELCIIKDCGYIRHTVWIDYEDIFILSDMYANKTIDKTYWGTIFLTTEHGDKINVPCHYIDTH